MNNMICLDKNFIAGLSDNFTAKLHRHPVLEIYSSCGCHSRVAVEDSIIEGPLIVVGPEVPHAIADVGKCGLAVFVDPLSEQGYSLKDNILSDKQYKLINDSHIDAVVSSLSQNSTENEVHSAAAVVIEILQSHIIQRPFSGSVIDAIELIANEEECFDMTVLAEKINLSKSRLAHLFSEQTGVTLKSYLQFKRIERAFRQMAYGHTITEAAYETGFSSSSHIASSSRKLTGMKLRELLNI